MDDYEFRPLEHTETELRLVADLLRHVFPHARHLTPAYLRWQYVDNPEGRARGINAYHQGRIIGHTAGQPLTARVEGKTVKGVLLVNTAVHPEHIRRNVSRRTTVPMLEEAGRQGYAFGIAIANARSTPPLLTRFKMVGPLDARIGMGLPRRREMPFAPSYEGVWTDDALRWRLSSPERPYSVRTRNRRTLVTAPSGRRGIGAILYDGDERLPLPEGGADPDGPLKVWLGLDPAVAWARSPYLPIPARLRPSPLNLVFDDLTGAGIVPDPARIVFRGIDFDAF